jgi:hypothetical protein
MIRKLLVLLLFLGLSGLLYSQSREMLDKVQSVNSPGEAELLIEAINSSNDPNRDLYLGILYHNSVMFAQGNNEDYLEKALIHLKAAYEKTQDSLALGYWGSLITLESGVAASNNNVIKAAVKLDEGSNLIDQAVEEDAENINLRMLRMNNAIAVSESSPFDRYDVVKDDLEYLKTVYASLSKSNRSMVKLIEGRLALHENRINDALLCFEESIREMPGSSYALQAENYLEELEE